MEVEIRISPERKLIGMRRTMSFGDDRTFELWKSFMPRRKEILNNRNEELISMQIYGPAFDFSQFDPHKSFDKWATVEVTAIGNIPEGMESFRLESGLYAVFHYKAKELTAPEAFRYIFTRWLPASDYRLDQRPHFEVLGEKYKYNDPDSEEEIWIPVQM